MNTTSTVIDEEKAEAIVAVSLGLLQRALENEPRNITLATYLRLASNASIAAHSLAELGFRPE